MARPGKGGGAYSKATVPGKLAFGTQEEIDARDEGPGAHPSPTSFTQIGPGDQGGDAANPSFKHLSADVKFGTQP